MAPVQDPDPVRFGLYCGGQWMPWLLPTWRGRGRWWPRRPPWRRGGRRSGESPHRPRTRAAAVSGGGLAAARRGTCSAVLELPQEVSSKLLHVPSNVRYFFTSSLETVQMLVLLESATLSRRWAGPGRSPGSASPSGRTSAGRTCPGPCPG